MKIFMAAQLLLGAFLTILVLLQNRGAGLGSAWGGGGELYITRRGMEKMLFRLTILVAALFVIVSLASLIA